MSVTNEKHYFLSGGGEMGEMIRAKDWSKTTLGDPDTWPQSLKTIVAVMLENPFGMYIAWGNDYIQLYNDGYRPILGTTKHPQALGISTRETFSEIWHIIGSMFDGVMQGTPVGFPDFMLPLNRNGFVEECYFDFSYSPIRKEDGEVGGILVTVIETTENKKATETLLESNKQFLNNIMHAPFAMCVFKGKDHTVEIANEQMLELWGKNIQDVLNKPIFEGLPEAKDQGLETLIDSVFITGEKFVANEWSIQLPRNGTIETVYLNFVYEALKENDGTISGIVAIAIDVTPQVLSRSKIEESEQKARVIVENAPFAIAVYEGEDMIVEFANQTIINIWGKGKDVIGKPFKEILPELDHQLVFDQIRSVYKTGQSFHTKNTPLDLVVDGNLGTYYFNYSFTPLYDLAGNIYAVMNTGVDLTDLNVAQRKIEEANKRFRNTVKQAPVGITILRGSEFVVEMANQAYLNLVDKKEDSFVGKPLFDSLPEVKESVASLLEGVLKTGIPFQGNEVPIAISRFGKQEISYFDFLYHPLKEDSGEISGILVTATEVYEKVEARKKIEQNEERLKIIVEASELGTWELNLKTREPIYSEKYLEIIGGYKTKIKLTHEQLLLHLHPDDMPIREKAFKEALITGNLHYEARVIWLDQSIHWMEGRGKVFFDTDNNPEKMIGTIRDITPEKQYQQKLEESEKQFRSLAESLPQLIWETDEKGNALFASGKWREYTGLTPSGEAEWKAIIHPDDYEDNAKCWMHSIETGEVYRYDVRIKNKEGQYRWHTIIGDPVYDKENKIKKWVGACTDIHAEKAFTHELEMQVKQRTKELSLINESLKKSEERYHLMVGEVQDYAILYLTNDGVIENWNMGAEKIKGYKAEEIVGKNFSLFYTESDQKNNLPKTLLRIAEKEGKAKQEGWRVRKDGSLFWANVVITAIHNNKQEIIGFSKVTHDLTEKKAADDKIKLNKLALEAKNEELEKMNKELQSFAYISSHDLQEPLRKIQAFSTLIMEKELQNLTDYGKDIFARMHGAAQRMQILINDLLSYSRTNVHERKFEKADIAKIIEEVREDMAEELEQKNAIIENCQPCIISIIPFQFRQLIYNLISNALKFAQENIPPHIKIKSEIALGETFKNSKLTKGIKYCHITIADNGIGFDQEYSDKIFEVFQRLHGRSQYSGTGIGLAIVKRIVDNHHGFISAQGEENKGATFDIYIPVT